ncbi:hypothetical protein [Streptomyces sp. NWU49]|uniref:hypothetical protein n=1 Tax=Streptomyces sp. NWU49 TaxID=2201153 RepID=UPI00215A732C|nr:hypothetical protein [Streptomyces sp. NWU49]
MDRVQVAPDGGLPRGGLIAGGHGQRPDPVGRGGEHGALDRFGDLAGGLQLPPLAGQQPVDDRGQGGQGDEGGERDDVVDGERRPASHQRQEDRGEERRRAGGDRPGQGEPGRDQHGGSCQQDEHPHPWWEEEVEGEHAEDQRGGQPARPPPLKER